MPKNGLSIEQEKAARLMASGKQMSDKQVAKKVGVKMSTLRSWKSDIKFKLKVLKLFDGNIDLDRTYRTKRINKYLKPVYREIERRLDEEGALDNIPFKELLRIMVQLQSELRLDGNFNKKFLSVGDGEQKGKEISEEDDGEDSLAEARKKYKTDRTNGKKVVNLNDKR